MANQIVVSSGAKVRDLNDVIIGTSGVLSSLAFNVANGVPKLDVNGKILVSQLPNSVMEYKGTWDASTNTPTLVNGTGNQGDVYLCNVAGTVNFGAGPIAFFVGDQVIYSGTIWQRASGATGTVTSVGLTSTGNDAITITGSPITTSGNINLGFAGTNLQYINGAGDLTTFPTLISSIGLSMPSAFSVANSPLTSNGTIAVTGAGYPSQYIRGDGTLADFPTSGGGGSSVSYYLNGGTSQGTIGGVTYYEMSKTADTGTMADFSLTGNGFIVAFLTDAGDPAQLNIPAGNWNYEIYASMSANGGTPEMYAELYKYDGTTFTLISTSPHEILYDGTALNLYTFAMTVPSTTLAITDRLAVKLYATNSGGKTTTVHTQDSHLCQIITTFSTGITALNGLTAQVQYFATGTSGTDFNISSTTATHTFNLPVASASNTGKLSSTDWSTFNGKVPYTGATANVDLGAFSLTASSVGGAGIFGLGGGTVGGYLALKKGTTLLGNITDYSSINANGTKYVFISDAGSTNYKSASFELGSLTNNTARTYTLPDATGTVALLESNQTFTGLNTFSSVANMTATLQVQQGLLLNQGIQASALAPYTAISGYANGLFICPNSGTGYYLVFPTSSSYVYTFPAATGTLALTSDLSAYLPLTGGTLTGTLFMNGTGTNNAYIEFQSASVSKWKVGNTYNAGANSFDIFNSVLSTTALSISNSSNVITMNYVIKSEAAILIKNGATITAAGYTGVSSTASGLLINLGNTGFNSTLSFPASNQTFTYPSATGTLALTSDLGSYLPLTGGTLTGQLYINPTNTATVGLDVASNTTRFRSDNLEGFKRQLEITMGSGTLVQCTAKGFGANYGTDLAFYTATTGGVNASPALYLTGTNNRVGIGTGTPASPLTVVSTSRSDTLRLSISGSSSVGDAVGITFGSANYDKAQIIAYNENVGNAAGYLTFWTGGSPTTTSMTERMRITSAGNFGFGTTTPSAYTNYTTLTIDNTSGSEIDFKQGGTLRGDIFANSTGFFVDAIGSIPLVFSTNGTERLRISNTGLLTYSGGGVASIVLGASANYANISSGGYGATLYMNGATRGGTGGATSGCVVLATDAFFAVTDSSTNNTKFNVSSSTGIVTINNLGTGTVYSTSGVLSVVSDMTLKNDDGFIENALEKVMNLKPRYFYWKEESGLPTDLRQLGFYAQEVNESLGEEVANSPKTQNDKWGIYDRGLIAMLTKAVQELSIQVEELKSKIN